MGTPRTPTILTSPQDAAIAFYRAFEAKDVDAMMLTWAEDEDIVCIHPGGTRLVGYDAVRAGWAQLFAGNTKLSFRLDDIVAIETVGLALQSVEPLVPESVEERLQLGEPLRSRPVQALRAVPPLAHQPGLLENAQVL